MAQIPKQIRAVRVHQHGDADALVLEKVPLREPGAGEALVRVEAAGVNFIDVYKRTGLYPIQLPSTLGEEGAGTVAAVGSDVTAVRIGDRVAWASVLGSYAEYAIIPADRLVPLPEDITSEQAAALMLQGMTAHYLAHSTYPLHQDDVCLVHAAAGGVGLLLVQIAKKRGAFVIGTAGSREKADLARIAGADEVIVYTTQDFVAETKRITSNKGVQVVYDSVGKTTFLQGLDVLAPRGIMVLYGGSSGPVDPIDPMVLNRKGSLFLTRPTLGHYVSTRQELLARAQDLFDWLSIGELSLRIDSTFSLDAVSDAHRALEGRLTKGKVLIVP
ncbi:MAG TPA: quinone oxidoreductase [Gemmatimonadaceae bacterium]|nr:quinone oxidoreductase [Gemmatimonadaceae bacterium]